MRNQILHGDVLEMGRTLDSGSVNMIVTSPPYYGLRDYGLPPTNWPKLTYAPMGGMPWRMPIPPMSCCLGLEKTLEAYVGHLVLVFRELWRVLRDDGTAWLNLGDSYARSAGDDSKKETDSGMKTGRSGKSEILFGTGNNKPPDGLKPKNLIGIPWRVAFALQADGWYLRSDIIWAKPNPMPESVGDRPTKSHEYIFLLTKRAKYWYDAEAIKEPNTWSDHNRFGNKNAKARRIKELTGNMSPDAPEHTDRSGRNKRSVWTVATKPYKGAHFACFPPKLIEPCILAGCPGQVCVECGEPWVRVVEKEGKYTPGIVAPDIRNVDKTRQDKTRKLSGREYNKSVTTKTLHFTPTCQCCPLPANKEATRPGIVLDPFFGSGTTAQVAEQTGRDWLGIDLNTDYIKLAQDRVRRTQPALFAR